MKIRTCWVSNSSSSSFICIGFRVGNDTEKYRELSKEYYDPTKGWDWESDKKLGFEIMDLGYDLIIGKMLNNEMSDDIEVPLSEVRTDEKVKKAAEFLKTDNEPCVFFEVVEC